VDDVRAGLLVVVVGVPAQRPGRGPEDDGERRRRAHRVRSGHQVARQQSPQDLRLETHLPGQVRHAGRPLLLQDEQRVEQAGQLLRGGREAGQRRSVRQAREERGWLCHAVSCSTATRRARSISTA
jgi:hypothetical protein